MCRNARPSRPEANITPVKKDIHRCRDMAFSEMVCDALLANVFARPDIAATLF